MQRSIALLFALAACGPPQFYRVRNEMRFSDAKLADDGGRVSVLDIALGDGVKVDGKSSGERVEKLKAQWDDIATAFNRALGEAKTDTLALVHGDTAARYVLQPEIISVRSGEDMSHWFGQWTETCVLFTLWDRNEKRVLERFTISGDVQRAWESPDAAGIVADKTAEYLAARFGGKEVEERNDP